MKKTLALLAAATTILAEPLTAQAEKELKICVWDIAGKSGPAMQAMREWQTEALSWGLKTKLTTHTNEAIAAEELKSGICDAALITGIRARYFNKFSSTIDSVGVIPYVEHLKTVLQVAAHPQLADKMEQVSYRIMIIAPA